ncbi:UDP-N-acetylglucosamine--N-acetylmuramyl-(pentapeptide) pyrophosphoryl-undecaprenol N-acetylglucosamine transferase [Paenibacillus forsythiae]|uniref:UDP-N-acetylglucosamine--N-acetylmuramyl-(pentapeptide) pyrophosphoryl-undecaprenol N-acetylglucosamine transferase n=1 Tax=Paenibacillus forsythiae TaxID=365616 RepID=A0ABU3H5A9_9BACL|nr:undecaprenyldiphospho-muramoylpentapeptide beta-N-acetylglucosaminyltransferase [Paenibacillus forsythiae]MDT3426003.1 UDP-N-acetylglucosamine--N-acetylmuramyl-(pentapeptide) pyrophosphoryl-undecaprenol N-acetylglucosamine transferase [Paenibacillus forsythiae]
MKRIMFTGGGSAGHVTVNIALIPKFIQAGWEAGYIGSVDGIERQLINSELNVSYHSISTGKLRRYFDWQNAKDPFKVVKGTAEAYRIIKKQKPDVVFSKGGFVSVPVVIGAWLNKIPVIIHESDYTPGLANRLASPFASIICTTFPETAAAFSNNKCRYIGPVLRDELKHGDAERGRIFTGFSEMNKPSLLIMGGSLGARRINTVVRESLFHLTKNFRVVHLCGKGQLDPSVSHPDYRQYEYINEELPDVLSMCDFVISRAGSNSIFEFLVLKKPMILIPLTKEQSRGDQLLNAASFERKGYCKVVQEEHLTSNSLIASVNDLAANKELYVRNMDKFQQIDGLTLLYNLIIETAQK